MPEIRIVIYQGGKRINEVYVDRPVVIGRRDPRKGDPPPIALHHKGSESRLVVADFQHKEMSRQWMQASPIDFDCFELTNLHSHCPVVLVGDQDLVPGQSRRFEYETIVELGASLAIRIEPVELTSNGSEAYRNLQSVPMVPGTKHAIGQTIAIGQFAQSDGQEINKMLQLALQVVQESAGSDAFFQRCASAAAEMADLHRAVILLRSEVANADDAMDNAVSGQSWASVAQHTRNTGSIGISSGPISTTLLGRVRSSGRTVIHQPHSHLVGSANHSANEDDDDAKYAPSLQSVQCAVASPILNAQHEVIGVIYGDRTLCSADAGSAPISDLEATLIEILAGALAGGLARREQERMRISLAEFFSPKVADQLASDPQLMEAKEIDVSALFCDIRKFSGVTERLGPRKAIEWINDVMTELSECVIESDGVLVNYMGDELFAMWGAPGEQVDHARRAIECARSMLAAIEKLRDRWSDVLPQQFGAGIGINTGLALVGNVGSRQKFQYGPLGNTVNLSSRLQSATKQLGVACLAGEPTVRAAGYESHCRRLAKLSVVGIEHPIDVYEVALETDPAWQRLRAEYERALAHFESGEFIAAIRRSESLVLQYPDDLPSRRLLQRAHSEMNQPSNEFSGVLVLTSK